jgi:hypothetical protein
VHDSRCVQEPVALIEMGWLKVVLRCLRKVADDVSLQNTQNYSFKSCGPLIISNGLCSGA